MYKVTHWLFDYKHTVCDVWKEELSFEQEGEELDSASEHWHTHSFPKQHLRKQQNKEQ